jgi:cobyrinic acid a,c-diamide synthase
MGGSFPRLVVAGTGGDSGKTLVSLGLAAAWRARGLRVAPFKKGPDYIDAAWLSRAARRPARNLDGFLMGEDVVLRSFRQGAALGDVAIVEGNRGLFDGYGGASTAALARTLDAPVLLVIDVTKTTRTAAAFVAGCRALDPELRIGGVIANRTGGPRHAAEVRRAIEEATGVPVLGCLPRLDGENLLPDRHLGLVPPEEHDRMRFVVDRLGGILSEHADVETLLATARAAPALPETNRELGGSPPVRGPRVTVGVFRDAAFTFYYPENLEALEAEGAEIRAVSAFEDDRLPELDLLYLGGGFPETHAEALAANRPLLESVAAAARDGLPVYAECGGLVYLSRSVTYEGRRADLAGVLDVDVEVCPRPQGHGYAEMAADRENPFFPVGTVLRGHEFHYSRIAAGPAAADLAFEVRRGAGSLGGRDGLTRGNVLATWLHVHALGEPGWAGALVARARRHRDRRHGDRRGTPTDLTGCTAGSANR